MPELILKDWYQIDFKLNTSPKSLLEKVSLLISELKKKKVIRRWFFLYENTTIRIRFKSYDQNNLQKKVDAFVQTNSLIIDPNKPFEPYSESTVDFSGVEMIETFANIMSDLSDLTIQFKDPKLFGKYKLVEIISHCVFNNVYGSDTEGYFMLKRIGMNFQSDNPEQTVLDDNQKYELSNPTTITIPSIRVPKK